VANLREDIHLLLGQALAVRLLGLRSAWRPWLRKPLLVEDN